MLKTNRIKLFFLFTISAVLVAGCSKDFVNNIKPTDSATASDVFQSPASVRVYFNGIYRQMRSQWISIDESA
jgi:S-adenosylmethionine:diacylglycerol 3-amino-3-carboxypropyl transferase